MTWTDATARLREKIRLRNEQILAELSQGKRRADLARKYKVSAGSIYAITKKSEKEKLRCKDWGDLSVRTINVLKKQFGFQSLQDLLKSEVSRDDFLMTEGVGKITIDEVEGKTDKFRPVIPSAQTLPSSPSVDTNLTYDFSNSDDQFLSHLELLNGLFPNASPWEIVRAKKDYVDELGRPIREGQEYCRRTLGIMRDIKLSQQSMKMLLCSLFYENPVLSMVANKFRQDILERNQKAFMKLGEALLPKGWDKKGKKT